MTHITALKMAWESTNNSGRVEQHGIREPEAAWDGSGVLLAMEARGERATLAAFGNLGRSRGRLHPGARRDLQPGDYPLTLTLCGHRLFEPDTIRPTWANPPERPLRDVVIHPLPQRSYLHQTILK